MKPQQLDHFRTLVRSGKPSTQQNDATPFVVEAAPLTYVDDHVDWAALDGWNYEMSVIDARRLSENLEGEKQYVTSFPPPCSVLITTRQRRSFATVDWRSLTDDSNVTSPNDDSIQSA